MLGFCAQHNIVCDIETIPIQKIDEAYERMRRGHVKYRFVIDMARSKHDQWRSAALRTHAAPAQARCQSLL